jgi:hypothetical protein
MREQPYTLALFERLIAGNALIGDVTDLLIGTWRSSKRRVGDNWLATAELRASRDEMDDWFQGGLLREIRQTTLGEETWRGAIVMMEYSRGGMVLTRDVTQMTNAVRSTYTRISDNLLSNGSGETGAWAAYNGATVEQDSSWSTHGTYSIKITVADATVRGAVVQSGIAIVASQQYLLRATLKVTSGSWVVSVNRSDTGDVLASQATNGETGDMAFNIDLANTNTFAGNVEIRVTSASVAGVVNVDAVVFQIGPVQAETGWYVNADAIEMFGRKEEVLSRSGMSTTDANLECENVLTARGWPMILPPRSGTVALAETPGEDVLTLTLAGYWAMLNWRTTTLAGTKSKHDWVAALSVLQPDYVIPGYIGSCSTEYTLDDSSPKFVGEVLADLAASGGIDGARYAIGVGAGRKLNYEVVADELSYVLRKGRLCSVAGDEIEPALVRPGWMLWEDIQVVETWLSGQVQRDPRWVYLESVELQAPTASDPNGSIVFSLD